MSLSRSSRTKKKVVIVGGYNADLLVTCSQLPSAGRSFMGGPMHIFGGGRGANMAVAAARAGCDVTFVGACGRDGFGGMGRGQLTKENINLKFFSELPRANTGTALILIETSTGRNMVMVAESANAYLTPAMVRQAGSAIRSADLVFAEAEISPECIWEAMQICEKAGVPFVLDASPCQRKIEIPNNQMLAIVVEDSETASVTGETDLEKAIAVLHRKGCQNVVFAHGSESITYSDGQNSVVIPIPVSQVVDRCGAVECLGVWIGLCLLSALPAAVVCELATAAMSFSLAQMGGQRGMPFEKDVAAVLEGSTAR
jgi:ribokinase